jgi:hypothetical protein
MEEEKAKDESVSKLIIDEPSDFRFHAAYTAYSKAWDNASSEEDKVKLNEIMHSLSEGKTSYTVFYGELSHFREEFTEYRGRTRIRGQRKRDWRRSEAKKMRSSRHKR